MGHPTFQDDMAERSFGLVIISGNSGSAEAGKILVLILLETFFQGLKFLWISLLDDSQFSNGYPKFCFQRTDPHYSPFSSISPVFIFFLQGFLKGCIGFCEVFVGLSTVLPLFGLERRRILQVSELPQWMCPAESMFCKSVLVSSIVIRYSDMARRIFSTKLLGIPLSSGSPCQEGHLAVPSRICYSPGIVPLFFLYHRPSRFIEVNDGSISDTLFQIFILSYELHLLTFENIHYLTIGDSYAKHIRDELDYLRVALILNDSGVANEPSDILPKSDDMFFDGDG